MGTVAPPPTVRTLVDQGARLLSACSPLLLRVAALGTALIPAGCYTGFPDSRRDPWETNGDDGQGDSSGDGDDAAGDDGDDGGDASLDDGATDPSAEGGATTASVDSADDGADDGGADGGVDGGGTGEGGVDDGGAGDDDGTSDGGDQSEVPDNAFCDGVAGWQPGWSDLEEQILVIVNQRRAQGANCGTAGNFGPAGPLTMNPALRCAARVHSKQMVEQNFFAHETPWGETPWQRISAAGYQYSTAGENIAAGNSTAAATMQQWMDSDGHCGNIMKPQFQEIGIGYYPGGGYGHYWTQKFGAQ